MMIYSPRKALVFRLKKQQKDTKTALKLDTVPQLFSQRQRGGKSDPRRQHENGRGNVAAIKGLTTTKARKQ
jgi:hypothetical protein